MAMSRLSSLRAVSVKYKKRRDSTVLFSSACTARWMSAIVSTSRITFSLRPCLH